VPELPEVETIRADLESSIAGKKVTSVQIKYNGVIKQPRPTTFRRSLIGARFLAFERYGKFLIVRLDNEQALIFHLRMTGQLVHEPEDTVLTPHTHVVFRLNDGSRLRFTDIRKFGTIMLLPGEKVYEHPSLRNLGVDALSEALTLNYLARKVASSRQPLKQFLMDQQHLAGIGNIYASEILFHARLHPAIPACALDGGEIRRLRSAIRHILRLAIRRRGTTIRDYRTGAGSHGTYQNEFRVYNRQGQPCRRCGTPIVRIAQAGRSTFFCPGCQSTPGGDTSNSYS